MMVNNDEENTDRGHQLVKQMFYVVYLVLKKQIVINQHLKSEKFTQKSNFWKLDFLKKETNCFEKWK